MNKQNGFLAVVATAAWLGLGGGAHADIEGLVKSCDGCHAADTHSTMPSIAGLPEFYHADQLHLYRDKERPCGDAPGSDGETTNMCAIAADLGDDQIDALAAHYAALPYVAAEQEFDPALAAAGEKVHASACEVCHSDGGSNAEDEAGFLAGQRTGYLQLAFDEYAAGKREQPDAMRKKMDALSADDVKALLQYYASQQ